MLVDDDGNKRVTKRGMIDIDAMEPEHGAHWRQKLKAKKVRMFMLPIGKHEGAEEDVEKAHVKDRGSDK